jgi:phosphatidylglycerol:prolipoprotein diacylglycerol transferase
MFSHFPGVDWLTPYGLMLALGGATAWWFARRWAPRSGLDPSHVDLVLPLTFAAGACANLLIALIVPQDRLLAGGGSLAEEFLRMPALVVAAVPVVVLYCHLSGAPFRRLADVLAPAALIATGIGYLGCFLAGCCFGDVVGSTEQLATVGDPQMRQQVQTVAALSPEGLPWAANFPADSFLYRQHLALGLIDPAASASLPVHPVQLYESAAALLLCFGLVRSRSGMRGDGTLALLTLATYAVIAFGLQFLRADSALVLGPLTATQLIFVGWLAVARLIAMRDRSRVIATGAT